jgi:hypothetical protein
MTTRSHATSYWRGSRVTGCFLKFACVQLRLAMKPCWQLSFLQSYRSENIQGTNAPVCRRQQSDSPYAPGRVDSRPVHHKTSVPPSFPLFLRNGWESTTPGGPVILSSPERSGRERRIRGCSSSLLENQVRARPYSFPHHCMSR